MVSRAGKSMGGIPTGSTFVSRLTGYWLLWKTVTSIEVAVALGLPNYYHA